MHEDPTTLGQPQGMTPVFGSFSVAGCTPFAGIVLHGTHVVAVSALRAACLEKGLPLGGAETLQGLLADWDRNLASIRMVLADGIPSDTAVPVETLHRHAPVAAPRQILCSGANYRKHVIDLLVAQGGGAMTDGMGVGERRAIAERIMDDRAATGRPYVFVKAASALAGPDDVFTIPDQVREPDWELELAVIIGKGARNLTRATAMDHVAGFTISNDITARDWVYRTDDMRVLGTDWLAGKCRQGFLPVGPYLVPRDDVANPMSLQLTLSVNGEIMQDASTDDMIFDIPRQLEYITSFITLFPGDIICTGSPAGNGTHHGRFLRDGDLMEATITGLGTQHVRCSAE